MPPLPKTIFTLDGDRTHAKRTTILQMFEVHALDILSWVGAIRSHPRLKDARFIASCICIASGNGEQIQDVLSSLSYHRFRDVDVLQTGAGGKDNRDYKDSRRWWMMENSQVITLIVNAIASGLRRKPNGVVQLCLVSSSPISGSVRVSLLVLISLVGCIRSWRRTTKPIHSTSSRKIWSRKHYWNGIFDSALASGR